MALRPLGKRQICKPPLPEGHSRAKKGGVKVPHLVVAEIVAGLREVFAQGRHADKVIEYAFKQHRKWGSRDRRLYAESLYDCVRHWRWLWHVAGLPDAQHDRGDNLSAQDTWMVWAAYWLLNKGPWPEFDELKGLPAEQWLERSRQSVAPALRFSWPDWLDAHASSELPSTWPQWREVLNEAAPVYLRANTLKTTRRALRERLATEGVAVEPIKEVTTALQLTQRCWLFGLPSFREGLFELQDAASQQVAPALEVEPGMRVIDACAGGGGKTLHLAALMQNRGRILALDVHGWKLEELRRRCRRAGVDIVETRLIENSKSVKRLQDSADRLLLDVPCSGMGVLRRNPDAKWKLSPEQLQRLELEQATILERYSAMVKVGGKMVYATCSILPAENERQIERFLSTRAGSWELEQQWHSEPQSQGWDGFFAARLRRIS